MKESNTDDKTNWKAWYAALIIVLLVQIAIYFFITNKFAV